MNGTFRESDYNETELSRLETKWMRFLSASALSRENLEQERRSSRDWSRISPTRSKPPLQTCVSMKTFWKNVWKEMIGN